MVQRDSLGRFLKGSEPWNKGTRGIFSEEVRRKISKVNKGKHRSPKTEFKKGLIPWNKGLRGIHFSSRTEFKKGHKPWNKGEAHEKILLRPQLKPNEELAYILGVLKGDGCVSVCRYNNSHIILLQTTSLKMAERFANALRSIGLHPRVFPIKRLNPKSWGKKAQYRAVAHSKLFVEWFRSLSLEDVEKIISEREVGFVRGFYESEGTAHHYSYDYGDKWKLEVTNKDRRLLEMVQRFLTKIGLQFQIGGPYKPSNPKSGLYYHVYTGRKQQVIQFLNSVKPCIKNEVA